MAADLRVVPLTLKQANALVGALHRHHDPIQAHRFSIGALSGSALVGCAIVGRPVSFHYGHYTVAEVSRLATNGHRNACSKLYGAAAQAAAAMGFTRIQTYTLPEESGASLRAVGWVDGGERRSSAWSQRDDGRTRHNTHPTGNKRLWWRDLNPAMPDGFDAEWECMAL